VARELTLSKKKLKEPGRTHLDTTDGIEVSATLKKGHREMRHVWK
jgi:hypothetical protein